MRIDSSNIGMDSARLYKSSSATRTTITGIGVSGQWNEDTLASFENFLTPEEGSENQEKQDINATPNALSDTFEMFNTRKFNNVPSVRDTFAEFTKLHQLMLRHIFELLFGKKNDNYVKEVNEEMNKEATEHNVGPGSNFQFVTTNYSTSSYFSEIETTKFQAAGTVKTADGQTIDINLNISMSRSFATYYEKQVSSNVLQVCDPLVINYGGNLADLDSEMSFYFDLDTDGTEEKIAKLTSDSGFLALDLNGDGVINDGSELFGTKSGDGFRDLAAYDEDGNGWIDEGDSIFEKLRIWAKDPNGKDILYTLKDQNVGAIYTGAIDTQFSLNDTNNDTMGYVRKTGLFLYENGTAGTMQHIDLVS